MDAGDWTIAALTAALVLITAYYAWQNKQMVEQMRASREVAVLPKLALDFNMIGPTIGAINVKNVGPGPALGIDITVTFEPKPGGGQRDERRLRVNLLAPSESRDFLPSEPETGSVLDMERLAADFARITLTGTLQDALGKEHPVEDVLDDLTERRNLVSDARVRWRPESEKQLAQELAEKLGKPLDKVRRELSAIGRAIRESPEASEDP